MKVYIGNTLLGWLLFIWALGFPFSTRAQSVDSLERVLATKKMTEKEKIKICDDLAWQYLGSDVNKSISFSKQGLEFALEVNDGPMEVTFYHNIGTAYYMKATFDSAEFYFDKSKVKLLGMEKKEPGKLAVLYIAYGDLYQAMSKYDQSIAYHHKAIKIFEALKDAKTLANSYTHIGGVYHLMRNNDQALHYFKKGEEMALKTNNPEALASVSIALSDLFLYLEKEKSESIHYAKQAARIFNEIGNKVAENMALLTLAKVHYHYKDYVTALPLAKNVVQQAEKMGYPTLITQSLNILSNIYYRIGNYSQSVELAHRVLKMDSTNTNNMINVYANLAQGYAHLGRFDLMDTYFERHYETVNSYSNKNYQNSLSEMEVKYESEKKELQIDALKKQRRLYLWLGIAGGLILLSALSFAVIRYRLAVSKRKLAEKETQQMEQEKQLVAVQATLDGEAAERTRLAKDLHDGLGSMLSVVKFNLPQMKGDAWLESVDVARFQTALGMLDDSIHELRRVAHHMMPETLLRFGLKVSISDFCDAIPITDFHYFGDEARLPEKLEIMVYRSIHELVNNALKHAKANHINVQLVQENDRLSFTVQDDGTGFDQNVIAEGMGLRNIRQRVEAFRGKMNIYSSEQGTEVHVELELTKNEQHD